MNVLECSAKVLRYFGEVQRGVCSRAKFNFILCYFFIIVHTFFIVNSTKYWFLVVS